MYNFKLHEEASNVSHTTFEQSITHNTHIQNAILFHHPFKMKLNYNILHPLNTKKHGSFLSSLTPVKSRTPCLSLAYVESINGGENPIPLRGHLKEKQTQHSPLTFRFSVIKRYNELRSECSCDGVYKYPLRQSSQ